jgi:uncharacterized protein YegP (UPF0339 family)
MIKLGEAVTKAKRYVANQTGAPYHSLLLESFKSEPTSHVIEFKEVASLGENVYGHYLIEVDNESGKITGFSKCSPHNPNPEIEPIGKGKGSPHNPNPEIEPIIHRKGLPEPQFEIYKDTDDKFRFRLRTPNGEAIAVSKVYESKAGCLNGIKMVKENASKAIIQNLN